MSFIGWIVIGGLAGWVASLLVKDKGHGLLLNIIIGVLGAFIGGFVFELIGGTGVTGFNIWSFFVALAGSIIFLWLISLVNRKS